MLADKVKEINISIADGDFDAEAVYFEWDDVSKALLSFDQVMEVCEVARGVEDVDLLRELADLALEKADGFKQCRQVFCVAPLRSPERIKAWKRILACSHTSLERKWLVHGGFSR